jgi:molybdopterin/thiamine biosynthesis adenylyltransferase
MNLDRYHRQTLLPQVGPAGQARLAESRVLLVGCGALGGTIAEQLVRAGVGYLRVVDRDIVELTNLQRQVLFTESDAREHLPKAVAAANRLRAINAEVTVEALVADVDAGNVEGLMRVGGARVDIILDGTDNVATRYLINDAAVKNAVPWVYGGCVGVEGRVMTVWPGRTPCLRCVFPTPPAGNELPTCDSAGVLGPAAAVVASLEAIAAIQVLLDPSRESEPQLLTMDLWRQRFHSMSLVDARREDCVACGQRRFEFLDAIARPTAQLCGRNAIQLRAPAGATAIDPAAIEAKLGACGDVVRTPYFVRCALRGEAQGIELTVFTDGRTIVHGTNDPARARSVYARLIGA